MKRRERQVKPHIVGGFAYLVLVIGLLMPACSRDLSSFSEGTREPNQGSDDVTGQSLSSSDCEGKTESFPVQASYRKLDILVAVDNTAGTDIRNKVAERMRPLIEKLGDSDYQVAIISGKLNACVEKVITKTTPNAVDELVDAIKTITIAEGEYINMKAITGLTNVKIAELVSNNNNDSIVNDGMCSNGWIRSDSVVAIMVISGQQHLCCYPIACTMPDIEDALRKIGRLSNDSSQRKLYRLYGLLNQSNEYTNRAPGYPPRYPDGDYLWYVDWRDFEEWNIEGTTTRLADFVKSIDDPNYDAIFDDIASDITTSLGDTFTLAETPDNKCADVFLTTDGKSNKLAASEYEVDGKTLKIKKVLRDKDTQVDIVYSH